MNQSDASAVILAGGKSSRMGSAKAMLEFDGAPLILHLVGALQKIFADIVIVAAPGQNLPSLPATIVRDQVAYQGPVGGIYYGLQGAAREICFVTSCDVAFINPVLISYLLSQIVDHDVVVPYWEDRFQPLQAVYRRSVLPHLAGQLERGELRPVFLFEKVPTRKITEAEIRRFDPDGLSFFNMNTPADYAAALKRWEQLKDSERGTEDSSVRCTVELFGAARLLAKTHDLALTLPTDATLADVYALLVTRLPALANRVIAADGRSLAKGYACNLNGLDFVRQPTVKVSPGDKILIISADAGG